MARNSKDRKVSQPWGGQSFLHLPPFGGGRTVNLSERQERIVIAEARRLGLLEKAMSSEIELLRIRGEIFEIIVKVIRSDANRS